MATVRIASTTLAACLAITVAGLPSRDRHVLDVVEGLRQGDIFSDAGDPYDEDAKMLASYQPPSCPLSKAELQKDGTFLTHLPSPSPSLQRLSNCSWYSKNTCCSAEDVLRVSHSDPEIKLSGTTRGCRDVLHLLMCAPCSPDQSVIFVSSMVSAFPVHEIQVCERFCDRLLSACGSALLVLAGGQAPDRVDALFRQDGLGFCDAVGLRTVKESEDAYCFSSARGSWRRVSSLVAALVALCALAVGRWL